jgi:hypothetical protein
LIAEISKAFLSGGIRIRTGGTMIFSHAWLRSRGPLTVCRGGSLGDKPVSQQVYFLPRQRPCEEVALGEVAAHLPECSSCPALFTPLPDGLEPEQIPQMG